MSSEPSTKTEAIMLESVLADEPLDPVFAMGQLAWFIQLRWLFVAMSLAVLLVARLLEPALAGSPRILWALGILVAANAGWWCIQRSLKNGISAGDSNGAPPAALLAFGHAQVAVDLLILTALLRYTGGIESPLAIFYLFHMAIGSLVLPGGHALAQGLWAILLFGGMVLGEFSGVLVPHYPLLGNVSDSLIRQRPEFVVTILGAVVCGILGTLYLTGATASRLRRRERQLQQANVALRKSQSAIRELQVRRSRFMQTAAHRLKSPLATIQTLANLVRDEIVKGSDARGTCERIGRCCSEGIDHVEELLTLARVQDSDRQRHRQARANVCVVVAEQCARYQIVAGARGLRLTNRISRDLNLIASVDPRDLADCVGNVIDNALKYSPPGGQVGVFVERSGASANGSGLCVMIRVEDTGMGFDPDVLAKAQDSEPSAFDAYRRGNNALAAGIAGSGLGLAIVRAVMEQAGGRIEIDSTPGRGTKFAMFIPAYCPVSAGESQMVEIAPPGGSPEFELSPELDHACR